MGKTKAKSNYTVPGVIVRCALLGLLGYYLFWRVFFTLPYHNSVLEMVLGVLLLICEFAGLFRLLMLIFNYINFRESPELMEIYNSDQTVQGFLAEKGSANVELPDVDVLVTACGEPLEILEKTIRACMHLHYPEKEKVHVHVLDDGDSPALEKLAKEYGAGYITRKEHKNAKAGNLNNALRMTNSKLVVVFDADMVPHADFLSRTVPHFLAEANGKWSVDNTKLGFLQTPQAFYTEDLYQSTFRVGKIVPNEQDQFYRNLQPCKASKNSVICCGSNAVMLRRALEEVGYFTENTITEDFATGLKIQRAGYSSLALDRTLAEGTTPDSLRSLIRQRERWGRGTIQTLRQCGLWSRDYTWGQRLNLLASLTCWFFPFERLYLFLAPMLYPLFRLVVVEANGLLSLLHWIPILVLSQLGMILASGRSKNLSNVRWAFIYEFSLAPFLVVPILKEVLGIRKSKFEVTGAKSKKKNWYWYYTIPFIVMLVLTIVSFSRSLLIIMHTRSLGFLLLLIWHVINLYFALLMIIFIFRVRDPKEHIIGFDKLAHNLNNYYLPVFDLLRLIFDPFIKREEGYEDKLVVDYADLVEYANKKIKKNWFLHHLWRALAEFGILMLVLIIFILGILGKPPVLITTPVHDDLARPHRELTFSNWKLGNPEFLSDFSDNLVSFRDGDMELSLQKNLDGSVSGAEVQTWDFFGFGKYSVVMKPVKADGTVSSFFTYTGPKDNNPWDEIDIEFPGMDTTLVQFNYFHNGVGEHVYRHELGFDASEEYHEYSFLWKEDSITWYVDGEAVYSVQKTKDEEMPLVPGHIMMNLWAANEKDPTALESFGKYTAKGTQTAYYKEFSYTPLEGLAQS